MIDAKDLRFIKDSAAFNSREWKGGPASIADIESTYWNYLDEEGNALQYVPYIPQDGILYQPGLDQFGNPYRIEYRPRTMDSSYFKIFPLEGDMY